MPHQIIPNALGTSPAFNPLYSVLIGTNDLASSGTGSHEQLFNLCHQAALAWLAVPPANKTLLATSIAPGNAAHLILTTTGAPAYLWYGIQSTTPGSFTVSVDRASPAFGTSTQSAADSYGLLRIPVPTGSHTFDITAQSGTITILGIGSPPPTGGPTVLAGDIPNQTNGNTNGIAAYTADIQSNIGLLRADGLDIRFVPTQQSMLATPAEMMDPVHPSTLGLSELAAAFQTTSPATVTTTAATAGFTSSSLSLGSHTVGIQYSGDSRYAPITATPVSLFVYDPTSSIALLSDTSTYPVQTPITLTATIPQPNASGLVNFYDEASLIGSARLNQPTANTAQLTLPSLPAGTHTLSAQYLGDAQYNASTSPPISINVSGTYTTTALSTTATRYFAATPISLTATVSPTYATGTVTFIDGSTTLGQAVLIAGTATLTTSTLAPGIHPLAATFSGNATQDPSRSPALYLEIDPNSTITTLSPLPASSPYGASLQLSAAVAPISATGMVTFSDGPSNIGQSTLPNATLAITTLAPGSHAITATYNGDTDDLPSISAPVATVITLAPSAISLAPIAASTHYGAPVQLSATVTPTSVSVSVTFFDGSVNIGQSKLPSTSVTINALAPGPHTYTATYSGDTNHSASNSLAVSTTIASIPSSITVAPLSTSIYVGSPVTLNATLNPSTATGTILFRDANLGVLGQSTVLHGAATLTLPSPTPGPYSITATYSGDASTAPATSLPVTTQVLLNPSTTSLTTSSPNTTFGSRVTLTATASPSVASGSVAFFDGTSSLGTSLVSSGIASLTISTLTPGAHSLHATYGGDTLYNSSTSAASTVNIALDHTTTTLTLAQYTVAANATAIASVRVASPNTNPTGTISLRSGGTTLVSGPLTNASNGFGYATLSFNPAALGLGQSPLTAFYSGDPDNLPSDSSATITVLTVTNIPTAATLTLSAAQIPIQGTVTLTATVSAPTGSVTFISNGKSVATIPISSSGTATYPFIGATIGTYSLTASYAANGIYAASTASPQTLIITPPLAATFSPTSIPMAAGSSAAATLTLTPLSGYTGPIQTVCSTSATFITCSVTAPPTLTSTTALPIKITIATSTAALSRPGLATVALALLLPLLIPKRRRSPLLLLLVAFTLQGCAEGGNFFSIPPGTQTITLTTTAAGTTIPASLTIAIQ